LDPSSKFQVHLVDLTPELVSLNVTFSPEIVDFKLGVSSSGSSGSEDSLATMAAFLIRLHSSYQARMQSFLSRNFRVLSKYMSSYICLFYILHSKSKYVATFPVLESVTKYWTRLTGSDITPEKEIFIGTVLPEGFIVSLVIFIFLHVPPSHDGWEAPTAV
jgi:hypothetical protein